jgi:16S rRNA (guanine966-N2)-methyltransferase
MLPDARCLDLFAGSGALGFEALSRGAASCLMVERNPLAIRSLQEAKQALGADSATILAFDSQSWLQQASGTFDLVFIDPPFADTTLRPEVLVRRLRDLGLLENDVWIYVEQPSDDPALPPEGFTMHRSQLAGNVRYSIWRAE